MLRASSNSPGRAGMKIRHLFFELTLELLNAGIDVARLTVTLVGPASLRQLNELRLRVLDDSHRRALGTGPTQAERSTGSTASRPWSSASSGLGFSIGCCGCPGQGPLGGCSRPGVSV
jgi:hypothetical protein